MEMVPLKPKTYHPSPVSGQALIEMLVAVSVLTIGFLGLVELLSRSLSLNRVVADNYVATYLAMEGVEVVKNILDANSAGANLAWNDGVLPNQRGYEVQYDSKNLVEADNRFLKFDPASKLYAYDNGKQTRFKRTIKIEDVGVDEIRVTALVDWTTRGGGSFKIDMEDHFYNWRKDAQE